jgi:hypothetical protein
VNVIGCSLDGWVAAEITTVAPQLCNKLVLVGAMGLKPERAEIFDYFLERGLTGLRRAFHRPEQSSEFMRYWGKPARLAFPSGDLTKLVVAAVQPDRSGAQWPKWDWNVSGSTSPANLIAFR